MVSKRKKRTLQKKLQNRWHSNLVFAELYETGDGNPKERRELHRLHCKTDGTVIWFLQNFKKSLNDF